MQLSHGRLQSPVVLQVSWLIPEKGIDDLIDAAEMVLARDPRVRFVLAGDGWCGPEYRSRVRSRGLEQSVIFAGTVRDPIGEGLFAMADVVCQPSRWQEAFGWTITEAMACERPVVATATGGIPEIVQDGVTGLLVPVRAPERLADAVLRLLADEPLRRQMGSAGRAMVQERFNLETNVTELLGWYGIHRSQEKEATLAMSYRAVSL